MKGYVYKFLNKDEKIIYIGSCGDLFKRLRQHFEHGHLGDYCYDQVLYPISSSLCISEIYLALVYCEVVFSCHFKSWIEVCKSCSSKNCFN